MPQTPKSCSSFCFWTSFCCFSARPLIKFKSIGVTFLYMCLLDTHCQRAVSYIPVLTHKHTWSLTVATKIPKLPLTPVLSLSPSSCSFISESWHQGLLVALCCSLSTPGLFLPQVRPFTCSVYTSVLRGYLTFFWIITFPMRPSSVL